MPDSKDVSRTRRRLWWMMTATVLILGAFAIQLFAATSEIERMLYAIVVLGGFIVIGGYAIALRANRLPKN